ncbi:MAG TPA: protein kinase, partial [Planctomycetota bacterium]|nr:protein kinase [Planctomycetota bacterium]
MDFGPLPRTFGDFRFEREAGRGAMGVVYEAEQLSTGRRCAVKVMRGLDPDEDAVERFRREGQLAAAIAHPCTVFVYAADEVDGMPFIAMEWMPGGTLKDHVEKAGPMPVAAAVDCTLHVLDGLVAAAEAGVVHRDVKPSNCFLDSDGSVKVGDFGLAKSLRGGFDLTMTGEFIGTPYFASPEQVRGRDLGARSDQYSLAATLFFLLTGRPMFPGTHAGDVLGAIVSDEPPSVRAFRKDVPRGLARVVRRALAKDPSDRYPDFDAFRRALLPYSAQVLAPAARGPRFAAWLLDLALLALLVQLATRLAEALDGLSAVSLLPLQSAVTLLWFTLFEGLLGRTPGKALLGLGVGRRLHGPGSDSPVPSLGAAAQRTALYMLLLTLGAFIPSVDRAAGGGWHVSWMTWHDWLETGGFTLPGLLALVSTMRRRNGWRGPHELLSRTFVYHRVAERAAERRKPVSLPPLPVVPDTELPAQLGPFGIRGVLARDVQAFGTQHAVLLAGLDPTLGRAAWIVLRPSGAAPLPTARRDLRRAPRPRWLGGGFGVSGRWDAFEAPEGGPLPEVVKRGGALPWTEARTLMLALAEELSRAAREGTLPAQLSLSRVWLAPGGRVRLLEAAPRHQPAPTPFADCELETGALAAVLDEPPAHAGLRVLPHELERGLLRFLSAVAVTLVAPPQRRDRAGGLPDPRRLPLPGHAADALVAMRDDAALDLDHAIEWLAKLTRRTASATRGMRVLEMLPAAMLLGFALLATFAATTAQSSELEWAAAIADEAPLVVSPERPAPPEVADAARTLLAGSTLEDLRGAGILGERTSETPLLGALLGDFTWSESHAQARLEEAAAGHPSPAPGELEHARESLAEARTRARRLLSAAIFGGALVLLGLLGALAGLVGRGNPVLNLIGVDVHTRDHGRAGRLRCALRGGGLWLLLGGAQLAALAWLAIMLGGGSGVSGPLSLIGFSS